MNLKNSSLSQDLVERSLASVWHPCTQMKHHEQFPLVAISHGKGAWLYDHDANRYLDAISSWWVNLFGHAMSYAMSLQKIKAAFGEDAVWAFKPTTAGNTIVMAFCTPRTFDRDALKKQAQAIEARWPLPAMKWLQALSPV